MPAMRTCEHCPHYHGTEPRSKKRKCCFCGLMPPTPAQVEALRWMFRVGPASIGVELRGGDFVAYYTQRWRKANPTSTWHPSTDRQHAYRRNGGRMLGLMAKAGLVRRVRYEWGVPIYAVTKLGVEVASG